MSLQAPTVKLGMYHVLQACFRYIESGKHDRIDARVRDEKSGYALEVKNGSLEGILVPYTPGIVAYPVSLIENTFEDTLAMVSLFTRRHNDYGKRYFALTKAELLVSTESGGPSSATFEITERATGQVWTLKYYVTEGWDQRRELKLQGMPLMDIPTGDWSNLTVFDDFFQRMLLSLEK